MSALPPLALALAGGGVSVLVAYGAALAAARPRRPVRAAGTVLAVAAAVAVVAGAALLTSTTVS